METRDRAPIVTTDKRAEWAARGGPQLRDQMPPLPMKREHEISMQRYVRAKLLDEVVRCTERLQELGAE